MEQVDGMCFSTCTLQGYQACLHNQAVYTMQNTPFELCTHITRRLDGVSIQQLPT